MLVAAFYFISFINNNLVARNEVFLTHAPGSVGKYESATQNGWHIYSRYENIQPKPF